MAQPFTEIVNLNYQYFASNYKDNSAFKNNTENYNLNLFYPKEYKSGNVLLIRLNTERIHSENLSANLSSNVTSFAFPVGFQLLSKNKKLKSVAVVIPKIASDFKDKIQSPDFQFGLYLLENYSINKKLNLKAGLYYNKEAFGNFFVPLIGVDWQPNERFSFFGVLPTNYKIEYNLLKNKVYTGVNFKSVTRSFSLSSKNQYVRFDEVLVKVFAEYYVHKNTVLFTEIGYSLGKNPLLYNSDTNQLITSNSIYSATNTAPVFNFGIAYRIRKK